MAGVEIKNIFAPNMPSISAVIITFNEARNIRRCLESLQGVVDEIVVLDSFSTDGTPAICREFGVAFFQHAFDGHIQQKNRALTYATHDLVLSLDADEALSERLMQSIAHCRANWTHDGYSMNRLTNYCGQWIHHSGWYPDQKLRLFDRRKAHWGGLNPHDRIIMAEGSLSMHLTGDLLHYSYYSVEEHRFRARKYADIGARAMLEYGKKGHAYQLVVNPLSKFLRNYLLKGGFLDGKAGWTICTISAKETFWKYRELLRLQKLK
jgi:glycosyltransferase involved in cell wall biosynthesis